jgi:CYTH domain-containing protein
MSTTRRFLLASSLARLIMRDRGGERCTEGHFPERAGRTAFVRLEHDSASLVLASTDPSFALEEAAPIPRAQAEALLEATAGQVDYLRTSLIVGRQEVQVRRYERPGLLDLVTVDFAGDEEAEGFQPSLWFGPEISADPAYQIRSIAFDGAPAVMDVPVSDAALNDLLDSLQDPSGREQESLLMSEAASRLSSAPPPSARVEEASDLEIEDNVIRELALALRPRPR